MLLAFPKHFSGHRRLHLVTPVFLRLAHLAISPRVTESLFVSGGDSAKRPWHRRCPWLSHRNGALSQPAGALQRIPIKGEEMCTHLPLNALGTELM